jgi:hypothetical protein
MGKDEDEVPGFSDEEWAEFERSFTADSASTASYKEPSARQRELTAKWKQEPPRDTGWRTDGPQPDPRPRELYPPPPEVEPRRKPRWARNLAWVLVTLMVVGAAVGLPSLFGSSPARSEDGSQTNGQTSYVTPLPSTDTGSHLAPAPSAAASGDPFLGSPAQAWAVGSDGLVLPPQASLGSYSRADVTKLETQARDFLAAANLDPGVLAGGTPEPALAMIDPIFLADGGQPMLQAVRASLTQPTKAMDPTTLFTRFKPSEALLATATVKVHGSMAPSLDKDGQLQVKADYLFVYALRPAGADPAATGTSRVVVRRMMTFTAYDPKRYRVTPGKLSITDFSSYSDGMPCGVYDGYYHPTFADGSAISASSPQPVDGSFDPYDQSVQPSGKCLQPTRS